MVRSIFCNFPSNLAIAYQSICAPAFVPLYVISIHLGPNVQRLPNYQRTNQKLVHHAQPHPNANTIPVNKPQIIKILMSSCQSATISCPLCVYIHCQVQHCQRRGVFAVAHCGKADQCLQRGNFFTPNLLTNVVNSIEELSININHQD
jgi:hypothetical protein